MGTITQAIANNLTTGLGGASGINFRNIIINGDMNIAQRGTSTASITSSSYNTVDRWKNTFSSLGTWTISQDTDVPTGQGFEKSLKYDCTTADGSPSAGDFCNLRQLVEGQNLQYLKVGTSSAQSLTASFWVKTNKTGTYICTLNTSGRFISKSYSISSSNTWTKISITFPGDTSGTMANSNANGLEIFFWLGAGSTFTSGTLQTSWGSVTNADYAVGQVNLADSTANEWYVTGVQLEAGTTASDFEFLPYDVNLARCLRYYQKSYAYGTGVGTNTTIGIRTTSGSAGGMTTGQLYGDLQFKGNMRTAPTMTTYDKAGNSGVCARLNGGVARTDSQNLSMGDISEKSCSITSTGTANAGAIDVHWQAVSEL